MWIIVELQIHKSSAFVPWQRENRSVHIGVDVLFLELFVEALHGPFGRVVVFAEVTKHDVFDAAMIDFSQKPC